MIYLCAARLGLRPVVLRLVWDECNQVTDLPGWVFGVNTAVDASGAIIEVVRLEALPTFVAPERWPKSREGLGSARHHGPQPASFSNPGEA